MRIDRSLGQDTQWNLLSAESHKITKYDVCDNLKQHKTGFISRINPYALVRPAELTTVAALSSDSFYN